MIADTLLAKRQMPRNSKKRNSKIVVPRRHTDTITLVELVGAHLLKNSEKPLRAPDGCSKPWSVPLLP